MANVVSGFFGGMAGCAMIGQSMINVKSGGRTRLSTLIAGVVLLILVVFLSEWVSQIPMAALVAVMIMVSIGTFNWQSIREFKTHPLSFNIVMLATVITTVFTHNLAYGVGVGVLISKNPPLLVAWRRVGANRVGMASATVLLAFILIGLLDSLHYRVQLESKPGQKAVYAIEVLSVLDALAAPLRSRNEKTYSAPFATRLYAKETMDVPGKGTVRD